MAGPLLFDRVKETATTTGTGTFTLAGAATGFRTFTSVLSNSDTCYYAIVHQSAAEWEVGLGTFTTSGTTLARTAILSSSNSNNAVNFSSGTKDVFITTPAKVSGIIIPSVQDFRLTTETGVPVSTSDRTSQSTIYLTPYKGKNIALYSGSAWAYLASAEVSLALSGLTSGKNYDVFAYDSSGTLTLELSAAWTNDTTRADALTTQDGVFVKSGTTTRRYVGTIRTTATTTTEDSEAKRFVWNMDNRVPLTLGYAVTTSSWTYGSGTWRQANADTANQVAWVCGIAGSTLDITLVAVSGVNFYVSYHSAIGIDSTTAVTGLNGVNYAPNEQRCATTTRATVRSGIGYHYAAWIERATDGTATVYGDNASDPEVQSGLKGWVMG